MKRTLALILALVLLLTTFAGCMKKKSGGKAEDTSEYEALYAPVLKKYKQAFDENWPREKFIENNLSPNLATLEKTAEPSFAFLDLNGDKTPELFIGRKGNDGVADDLYTITKDGDIQQIGMSDENKTVTVGTDDRIYTDETDGTGKTVTTVGLLEDSKVEPTDTYLRDPGETTDGEHEWFRKNDSDEYEPITEEEYIEGTKREPKPVNPKPFRKLDEETLKDAPDVRIIPAEKTSEADYEALYAPVLEVYKTAVDEKWTYDQCYENDLVEFFGNWFQTGSSWSEWYTENTLGYVYRDLDSDGQPELLIGTSENPTIVNGIYAIQNEKVVCVLKSENDSLYVFSSGDIRKQSIEPPFSIHQIKNGAANFIAGYCPYDNDYYKTSSEAEYENIDYENYRNTWQRVSESEIAQLDFENALTFNYIPFGSNVDGQSTTIRDCYRDVLDDCAQDADFYTVYDIDNDGVPELIILMGHYEAEYYYEVYSYDDTEKSADSAGTFEGGHVGLYGIPGENGMYAQQAFQGNETIFLITMQNGEIKQETVSTQNIGNGEYTELDHYIETSYLQEDFEYSLLKTIK